MARLFDHDRLVIASHNPGKVSEIADLMRPFVVEVISAADLNLDEPEETGTTFADNALLKAHAAAKAANLPALADDSGLVVNALAGAPGVYSARWAGADKDFIVAMEKVEELLRGSEDRSSMFVCALALAWPDGHADVFEGFVEGEITWPPRGEKGFGYDPIFTADGEDITFAEMEPAQKHTMSHRADAFQKLVSACFGEPNA
jgi:XTP/dITP diphosphohydrolase